MFPDPIIFGIPFQWYTLWQHIALVISLSFALTYFKFKRPFQMPIFSLIGIILILIIWGYVGARLFSILDHLTLKNHTFDWTAFTTNLTLGRLRWYGTLLFILLGVPLIAKLFRTKALSHLLDFLALSICLFTAIIKQACLFSGDGCYGTYTTLPWGMYFPYGIAPNILPVHPTPLYDTLFHLTLFGFLYYWNTSKHKKYAGQTAVLFFVNTALFNIALDCIRLNPPIALGLSLPQFTYITILFIALFYHSKINQTQKKQIQVSFES